MASPGAVQRVVLTYDDYAALPADGRRYELYEGEIQVNAAPTPRHQRISRDLGFLLHAHVQARKLGEILFAPIDVSARRPVSSLMHAPAVPHVSSSCSAS